MIQYYLRSAFVFSLFFVFFKVFAQPTYTANDLIAPYTLGFYPGVNMGVFPPFTDEDLADFAIGNEAKGITGVGARSLRPGLFEAFLGQYGYDARINTYEYFKDIGLNNHNAIVGFPQDSLRDPNFYCSSHRSELFANLYEPIWVNGVVNPNNYYAHYMWETVSRYKDYVKVWEIWNEPGFDYTFYLGYQNPGTPGNWWENDPNPCDYKLRAPIQHYVRLLRISYEIIKTLDPESYVLCGGVGYPAFLDAVMRNTDNPNGGTVSSSFPLKGGAYFDILGYHSYPHFDGSVRAWNNAVGQFDYFRHSDAAAQGIVKVRDTYTPVLEKYGYDGQTYPEKLITITEINVPRKDFVWGMEGDTMQRNFLTKAYVTCARENFVQMQVYALGELGIEAQADDEFDLMGIYEKFRYQDGVHQKQNPEGVALKTATDLLFQKKYDANRTAQMQLNAQTDGAAFLDDITGLYTYVVWAKTSIDQSEFAQLTFTFPVGLTDKNLRFHDWDFGGTQESQSWPIGQAISLDATPVFFTETSILTQNTVLCQGETLNFEIQSSISYTSLEWTFEGGNPSTSLDSNVEVVFDSVGIQQATVHFLDANGGILYSETLEIKVDAVPSPSFAVSQNGALVLFENTTASDAQDFTWDFGDGSNQLNPNTQHVYTQDGSYTVVLAAENHCGLGSANVTIQVDVPTEILDSNTANEGIPPYNKPFRPGVNVNYTAGWLEEELADIAAGNPSKNQKGVGARASQVSLPQSFLDFWGYDIRVPQYDYAQNLNMTDNVAVLGFPSEEVRDKTDYCADRAAFVFENIYTEIWDAGANGTPINEKNPYALYVWNTVRTYKDVIEFWQVFESPDYDESGKYAWLSSGDEGNWWDFDPDPCNVSFHAPVQSYVRMLRILYEVVRQEDPESQVLLGGVSYPSFLDAVMRNTDNPDEGKILTGIFEKTGGAYFDAIGFNAFPHIDGSVRYYDIPTGQFIESRHSDAAVSGVFALKNRFETVLQNRGYDGQNFPQKHWVISETNAPRNSFNFYFGGNLAQRNYVSKALVLALANDIKRLTIHSLSEEVPENQAFIPEQTMGLYQNLSNINPYNQIKNESGKAYHTASDLLYGSTFDANRTADLAANSDIGAYAFLDPNGKYIYALWAKTKTDLTENAQATYSFPAGLINGQLYRKDWDWADSDVQSLINPSNIALTGTPIFLTEAESPALLPAANFIANVQQICPGNVVIFENLSLFSDSVVWDFPGGLVLDPNSEQPIVQYDHTGSYDVYLTAFNADGSNTSNKFDFVVVGSKPTANFTFDLNSSQLNAFQAIGGYFDSLTWILPNGQVETSFDISYFFTENGVFPLTLIAHNPCGSDTLITEISIQLSPTSAFNVILPNQCDAFYVGLQNIAFGSPTDFEWIIPSGIPNHSTEPNEWITFPKAGTYEVTLIVSNGFGADTTTQTFNLFGSATLEKRDSLCIGESLTYLGMTFDEQNPTGQIIIPGVANGGCDSIFDVALYFYPPALGSFVDTFCFGEIVDINGYLFDAQNPSGIVQFPNISQHGCDSTVQVDLHFRTEENDTISQTLIIGESYNFCGSTLSQPGVYTCNDVDQFGCDSTTILHLDFTVKTTESSLDSNIRMFPNPSTDFVFIDFGKLQVEQAISIELFDTKAGLSLQNWQVSGKKTIQFSVGALPSGSYLILIKNELGEVLFREFLVKI